MTLENSFKKVIHTRGLLTSLGYSKFQVQNLKRNFTAEKISIELMRKVLINAGYKCVQVEKWEHVNSAKNN